MFFVHYELLHCRSVVIDMILRFSLRSKKRTSCAETTSALLFAFCFLFYCPSFSLTCVSDWTISQIFMKSSYLSCTKSRTSISFFLNRRCDSYIFLLLLLLFFLFFFHCHCISVWDLMSCICIYIYIFI
jgi:hypothetical protein